VSCAKRLNRSTCRLACGLWWAEGITSSMVFARWRQCALKIGHIGATWRIPLNRRSAPAACGRSRPVVCGQISLTSNYYYHHYYCYCYWYNYYCKTSAVAEMGDRGHNRHGPKRGGAAVALSRRAATPSNTMWPGPRSTSVPSGVFVHPAV